MVGNTYIATALMVLQAMERGLGTARIGCFDQDKLKTLLEIAPDDVVIVSLLAAGYQDEHPKRRAWKELEEMAFMKKWGKRQVDTLQR